MSSAKIGLFPFNPAVVVEEKSTDLLLWLTQKALPLWLERGFCAQSGRFFEYLTPEGEADRLAPLRARVPPRQIYSFALGLQKGWQPAQSPDLLRAYQTYVAHYRLSDGSFAALCDSEGQVLAADFDLYNQAFVLLALSELAKLYPPKAAAFEAEALALLALIQKGYRHPLGGYYSRALDQDTLESNPHMHFLEAALAWADQAGQPQIWADLADEIVSLALERFIDREIGALHEFFDPDWMIAKDSARDVVEPGHQFEWAWLLARWAGLRGRQDVQSIAEQLYHIGREHGVNAAGLAFMSMRSDLTPKDASVRLWPQTEWIKAAALLARQSGGARQKAYLQDLTQAVAALQVFLQGAVAGAWKDRLSQSGEVLEARAPASSFYHIICALHEMEAALAQIKQDSKGL